MRLKVHSNFIIQLSPLISKSHSDKKRNSNYSKFEFLEYIEKEI